MLAVLIVAGETVFALPFHVARFFRPTLLATHQLDNADLGWMQSAYGLVAMLCYAPGGWLADRFPAKVLVPLALVLTGLGGVYWTTLPSARGLFVLHMYWGVTTVLLFWGALIRATRDDAPRSEQGRAFGLLDGGRGLLAAIVATAGLLLLSDVGAASPAAVSHAVHMKSIIWLYTGVTFLVAGVSFWVLRPLDQELKPLRPELKDTGHQRLDLPAREPSWRRRTLLHGAVIVAAYCGYKGIDFYSTLATQVFAQDELQAASWATWTVWLRPPSAVIAGLLAERFSASKLTRRSFWLLAAIFAACGALLPLPWGGTVAPIPLLAVSVLGTSVLLYGLRALYFVLLSETGVPAHSTGTTVGLVSVIGYTPDFFFPGLAGLLLASHSKPAQGYALLFGILALISLLGGWSARWLTSERTPRS